MYWPKKQRVVLNHSNLNAMSPLYCAKLKIFHSAPIFGFMTIFMYIYHLKVDFGLHILNDNISASKQDINYPKTPHGAKIYIFYWDTVCIN